MAPSTILAATFVAYGNSYLRKFHITSLAGGPLRGHGIYNADNMDSSHCSTSYGIISYGITY
jgi:hypothetical protein